MPSAPAASRWLSRTNVGSMALTTMVLLAVLVMLLPGGASVTSSRSAVPALPHAARSAAQVGSAVGSTPTPTPALANLPIGVAAGQVVGTLAPWGGYAAPGYHKLSGESQNIGPAVYDPLTGDLWIGESSPTLYQVPGMVLKVNALTMQPDGIITAANNATGLAFDPANGRMYVANSGLNAVQVFDATTGAVAAPRIPVGPDPGNLSYNAADSLLYVFNNGNTSVTAINTTTDTVVAWASGLGAPGATGALAYDNVTNNLAVLETAGVAWLNAQNLYVRSVVALGNLPESVTFDHQGWAYVGDQAGDVVVVNFTMVKSGPNGLSGNDAFGATYDPGLQEVFFTNRATSRLAVVSTSTQQEVANYPVGVAPTSIVWVPGTHQVDVVSSTSMYPMFELTYQATPPVALGDTVSGVDGLTGVVNLSSPNLAGSPSSITYDADGGSVVVGDVFSNNLTIVSATSPGSPTTRVMVNGSVGTIAYDPLTHTLWVPLQEGILGAYGSWTPSDVVLVLNASTGALVTTICPVGASGLGASNSGGDIQAVLYDPGTQTMVIAFLYNSGRVELTTFDPSTYAYAGAQNFGGYVNGIGSYPIAPSYALDPAQHELFATDPSSGALDIFSLPSLTATATRGVGYLPAGVAYDSADGDVYVTNQGSYNLTILNATTMSVVVPNVPMSGVPLYVTYDPDTQLLYVGVQRGVGPFPSDLETSLVVLDGSSTSAVWGPWPSIYVGWTQLQSLETCAFVPSNATGTAGQIWNTNTFDGSVTIISIPPVVTSLTASPSTVEVGQSLSLTGRVVGGTDGISLLYTGLPTGCASSSTPVLGCTPTTTGTYNVVLTAVDGLGLSAAANATVTVVPALGLSASIAPTTVDLGAPIWANASASGGSGPVNLTWSLGDGSWGWGHVVMHVYAAAGTYRLLLNATDALGAVQSFAGTVTVEPLPTISVSYSPSSPTPGATVTFQSMVSGGLAPWGTVFWTFGDGTSGTGSAPTHVYRSSGAYTVNATVTDAVGNAATATVVVSVAASPALTVGLALGANQTSPHAPVSLFASPAGGEPAYSFDWMLNGTTTSGVSATLTYTPAGAGNYSFAVIVTDAAGSTATAHVVLEVLPPAVVTVTVPTPVPGPTKYVYNNQTAPVGLSALLPYAGLGIGLGLLVGLLLGALLFRRRREPAETPSGSTSSEGPEEKGGAKAPAPEAEPEPAATPEPEPASPSPDGSGEPEESPSEDVPEDTSAESWNEGDPEPPAPS